MADRSLLPRVLVGLLLLGAAAALGDALYGRRDAELDVVKLQVESIRNTALSLEMNLKQLPEPCGDEDNARAALAAGIPEEMGECGQTYYGREALSVGPYWLEVHPERGDFTVHGLARRGEEVLHVTATRDTPPKITLETP